MLEESQENVLFHKVTYGYCMNSLSSYNNGNLLFTSLMKSVTPKAKLIRFQFTLVALVSEVEKS